jgi:hypothetical protein
MMARNATVPLTGRIQKRKTDHLRIVIFGLQRAAGLSNQPRKGAAIGAKPMERMGRNNSGWPYGSFLQ